MDLVLDNNIVLDHIDRREPFYELSRKVCLLGVMEEASTYISVNMLTDIYYLLRKDYGSQVAQDMIEQCEGFSRLDGRGDYARRAVRPTRKAGVRVRRN